MRRPTVTVSIWMAGVGPPVKVIGSDQVGNRFVRIRALERDRERARRASRMTETLLAASESC